MSDKNVNDINSVKVVRVFLASPNDLGDERRIAREAVVEINRTVARPAGFHVDLIGWEDTLSSAGRPQAVINEDLASCQMFIGMLWARWGTPPDTEGSYTSGFEEEFQLALKRNRLNGDPHITLLFKDVEQSKLSDAGPELSKVLAFKKRTIEEKEVLFDTFLDLNTFANKVRLSVADFIHKLDREARLARPGASSGERTAGGTSPNEPASLENSASGNHAVEATFLAGFSQKIAGRDGAEPSAVEIARLRNIAAAYGQGGNDQLILGSHDANLVYQGRAELDLSPMEISALADAGLDAWARENSPLWFWLASKLAAFPPWLVYSTVVGPDQRRIGAFRAMTVMNSPLVEDDFIKTETLDQNWFDSSLSDAVKNAALGYIGSVGAKNLVFLAENEFRRNNYATRTVALEAILNARGRVSARDAAQYAIGASFDVLGHAPMALILSGMGELDEEVLRIALDHRSGAIRAKAIETLSERKKLDDTQIRRFFGDTSIEARRAAVTAYDTTVRQLSDDEMKDALVLKETKGKLGGISNYDHEGQAAFVEYKRRRLAKRSLSEIDRVAETDPSSLEDYYFAIAGAHFSRAAEELRYNIDDRFADFWQRYLNAMRRKFDSSGDGDIIAGILDEHQTFRRRTMVRRALDILVGRGDAKDLPRLRKALDDDAADPRVEDIDYLGRRGNWGDILRIAKIANDYRITGGSAALLTIRTDLRRPALAILKLAGERIAEVLGLDISPSLLAKVVSSMPMATFRKLGQPTIEKLLHWSDEVIRKATSLQILCSFGRREATAYLTRHLTTSGQRYYNVIHWLDISIAWDRDKYQHIAKQELKNI